MMTDEQILEIARSMPMQPWGIGSRSADLIPFARAILAKQGAGDGLTPEWIWNWLMDYCQRRAVSPATHDSLFQMVKDARAILAAPRQPGEMGAGVPEGWVPLTLEFDKDGPEDVAYGPKRMMDRLGKWLDNYFKLRISEESKEAGSELDEQTVSLRAYVSVRDSFLRIEKICREHGYNYDSVIHDWLEKTLDARVPTKPIAWMRSGNTAWTGFVMHEDKVRLLPHSPETAQYDIPLYAHPAASAQQDERAMHRLDAALEARAILAARDGSEQAQQVQADAGAVFAIREAMAGIGNCISGPMWANHAEVSKHSLKKWHKALHTALSAMSREQS